MAPVPLSATGTPPSPSDFKSKDFLRMGITLVNILEVVIGVCNDAKESETMHVYGYVNTILIG